MTRFLSIKTTKLYMPEDICQVCLSFHFAASERGFDQTVKPAVGRLSLRTPT
jgi:hypothetical protein